MMKKIILFFMLLTPFFFSACEDVEEVTGKMDLTINGENFSFPMSTFVKSGDYTTITSTDDGSKSISIIFKGKTTGNYTLGLGKNLIDVLDTIFHMNNPNDIYNIYDKNVVIYYPTGNSDEAFVSLFGTLTISEYSSDKITGTFSGKGLTKDKITTSIDSTIIVGNYKDFSGTFTAKSYGL